MRLKEAPVNDVADTSTITAKQCHPADELLASLKVKDMKDAPKYAPDLYGALIHNGSYLLLTGARLVTIDAFALSLTRYGDQDMTMNDLVILEGGEMVGVLHLDVRSELEG